MEPALCPRVPPRTRTRGCALTVFVSILGRSAVYRPITRVGNQLSYTVQEIIFSNTPSYGVSGSSLGSCQERVVYAVTQRRLGPFFTLTPYLRCWATVKLRRCLPTAAARILSYQKISSRTVVEVRCRYRTGGSSWTTF
jgi:hypothetical protein